MFRKRRCDAWTFPHALITKPSELEVFFRTTAGESAGGLQGCQTKCKAHAERNRVPAKIRSALGVHSFRIVRCPPISLLGFQRNSVRRGVLNGLAQWLDEAYGGLDV